MYVVKHVKQMSYNCKIWVYQKKAVPLHSNSKHVLMCKITTIF